LSGEVSRRRPPGRKAWTTYAIAALLAAGAFGCASEDVSDESASPSSEAQPASQKSASDSRESKGEDRRALRRERQRLRAERLRLRRERAEARRERQRIREAREAERRRREREQREAQPAPAPSCHASYEPCLDPNASDYDCEGGSGDGPEYTGFVTVKGPDDYGLDSDGDGTGCE
jgi:hypothetical protein